MSRILFALLALLAGCDPAPCVDRVYVYGPHARDPHSMSCDERAALTVHETPHGMMVRCVCRPGATP
jgi:hypothetical protein